MSYEWMYHVNGDNRHNGHMSALSVRIKVVSLEWRCLLNGGQSFPEERFQCSSRLFSPLRPWSVVPVMSLVNLISSKTLKDTRITLLLFILVKGPLSP